VCVLEEGESSENQVVRVITAVIKGLVMVSNRIHVFVTWR